MSCLTLAGAAAGGNGIGSCLLVIWCMTLLSVRYGPPYLYRLSPNDPATMPPCHHATMPPCRHAAMPPCIPATFMHHLHHLDHLNHQGRTFELIGRYCDRTGADNLEKLWEDCGSKNGWIIDGAMVCNAMRVMRVMRATCAACPNPRVALHQHLTNASPPPLPCQP